MHLILSRIKYSYDILADVATSCEADISTVVFPDPDISQSLEILLFTIAFLTLFPTLTFSLSGSRSGSALFAACSLAASSPTFLLRASLKNTLSTSSSSMQSPLTKTHSLARAHARCRLASSESPPLLLPRFSKINIGYTSLFSAGCFICLIWAISLTKKLQDPSRSGR
ncbi:hypothetical protein K440DRAFT_251396 [Wilcoxina mikolae CBS 423.85]|nr:hypothetical protein K440DRAFT_251396 [Wilcoxina mikolae CBS 423.85]